MSGNFKDLKAFCGLTEGLKAQISLKQGESRGLALNGALEVQRIQTENEAKVQSNNLAEKILSPENMKYSTEIKNPNVLKKLVQNPFQQLRTESKETGNNFLHLTPLKESSSPSSKKNKTPTSESEKKTPDKQAVSKDDPNSKVHFTFQKEKETKKSHLIHNQVISFDQSQNIFNQPRASPLAVNSFLFDIKHGDMNKMYQNVQNPKMDIFASPQIFKNGVYSGMGINHGNLDKFIKSNNLEETQGKLKEKTNF